MPFPGARSLASCNGSVGPGLGEPAAISTNPGPHRRQADGSTAAAPAAARPRRSIAIRPRAQYEAFQERRQAETSPEYQIVYARRAGIEGTLSQGVRRCGLRQSRYVGLPKTQLGHVATAAASGPLAELPCSAAPLIEIAAVAHDRTSHRLFAT